MSVAPSAPALRSAMQELATAYAKPELQQKLQACRKEAAGMEIITKMRELLLPVQKPVLDRLGFSVDAAGVLAMQNAVNRRVCEGDVELKGLANQALRLLDLAPMKHLAQEVSAEQWFQQLYEDNCHWDAVEVETLLAVKPETAELLAELRTKRHPRSRISLGVLTVWSHWDRIGLPEACSLGHGSVGEDKPPSSGSSAPARHRTVARLESPSAEEVWEYVRVNEPVVISGLVDEKSFPPLQNFADFQYLRQRCGSRLVKVKGDMASDKEGRHLFMADPAVEMPFSEYLGLIEEAEKLGKAPAFYMGKMPLSRELPELHEDITSSPDSPWTKLSSCFGPNTAGMHTYFGCGHNTTAIHFDPSENILVVIAGTKTFELYPPTDVECLYPTKPPGFVHSAVPPFLDPHAMSEDFKGRWPLYEKASPVKVDLKAGDVLYLPIFWWHAVTGSAERNMIVNWWADMRPDKSEKGKAAAPQGGAAQTLLRAFKQHHAIPDAARKLNAQAKGG